MYRWYDDDDVQSKESAFNVSWNLLSGDASVLAGDCDTSALGYNCFSGGDIPRNPACPGATRGVGV